MKWCQVNASCRSGWRLEKCCIRTSNIIYATYLLYCVACPLACCFSAFFIFLHYKKQENLSSQHPRKNVYYISFYIMVYIIMLYIWQNHPNSKFQILIPEFSNSSIFFDSLALFAFYSIQLWPHLLAVRQFALAKSAKNISFIQQT